MFILLAMTLAVSQPQLSCSVSRGKVEIRIPAAADPAIDSLAVVRSGRWFTIVDDEHRLAPYRPGMRRLVLPTNTQRAVVYRDGKKYVVKAFGSRGLYRIVLSGNLETEEENMSSMSCNVRVR